MEDVRSSQRQRLEYVDFCLFFLGKVSRSILLERFEISSAAATRDLKKYKDENEKNIIYDNKLKEYSPSDHFHPIYKHDAFEALAVLSKATSLDEKSIPFSFCERPVEISPLNPVTLAQVSRAIYQQKPLLINYYSMESGLSKREFVPFTFIDTGVKWNVRGFDRKRGRFLDFVVGRIKDASVLMEGEVRPEERPEKDNQWNRIVEMEIVPHPKLTHPETVIQEHGIKNGILRISARAATVGYFLRRWNIDCGRTAYNGDSEEYQLWLKNNLALYGVEGLKLTPRYQPPE